MAHDILIVDDEADICMLIADILKDEGIRARQARDADEALSQIQACRPTLIILDIWLQGSRLDGLELLREVKLDHPDIPVLIISGHGSIEMAVTALKQGAENFIEKPFQIDSLLVMITQAIEAVRLKRENAELRLRAGGDLQLIGHSNVITHLRATINKVAVTNSRVLITGLPGSGKELVARLIHQRSDRVYEPFVVVNCRHLEEDQFEQQLFGNEQRKDGAARQIGLLEQAHRGTLLLDEVASLPLSLQSKVLRTLQDNSFTRLGGKQHTAIDVRFLATTHKNLEDEISKGRFYQDLFDRLNVVSIRMSPLIERRSDITLLANHFIAKSAATSGRAPLKIKEDAMAVLRSYDWPGNVSQLRNVIEWLLIMRDNESTQPIRTDMLPAEIGSNSPTVFEWMKGSEIMELSLRDARELFEREYLLMQLLRFDGNISRTAIFISMERSALHRKLKTLGVIQGSESLLSPEA